MSLCAKMFIHENKISNICSGNNSSIGRGLSIVSHFEDKVFCQVSYSGSWKILPARQFVIIGEISYLSWLAQIEVVLFTENHIVL